MKTARKLPPADSRLQNASRRSISTSQCCASILKCAGVDSLKVTKREKRMMGPKHSTPVVPSAGPALCWFSNRRFVPDFSQAKNDAAYDGRKAALRRLPRQLDFQQQKGNRIMTTATISVPLIKSVWRSSRSAIARTTFT